MSSEDILRPVLNMNVPKIPTFSPVQIYQIAASTPTQNNFQLLRNRPQASLQQPSIFLTSCINFIGSVPPRCRHLFHEHCLSLAIDNNPERCPTCKTPFWNQFFKAKELVKPILKPILQNKRICKTPFCNQFPKANELVKHNSEKNSTLLVKHCGFNSTRLKH